MALQLWTLHRGLASYDPESAVGYGRLMLLPKSDKNGWNNR